MTYWWKINIWWNATHNISPGKWKLKQPWDTATYLFEWSKSRTLTTFYADEDEDWQELLYTTGSVWSSSVTQSCLTLCDPMNDSTPDLPVHHQLLEATQTHVHRVGDAIQPSHPLASPSPPAFGLSQHQGLFKWVSFSHQVAKVLVFQLQHQSFQWTPRTDLLKDGLVGSPCSPRDSRESSPTSQFKNINSSTLSFP